MVKEIICGLDEVGRGCLAGPVVAAAVVLSDDCKLILDDSKRLSPAKRKRLSLAIRQQAYAWAIGLSWPREIERINILRASLLSMKRAVYALPVLPSLLLVDGNQPVPCQIPQQTIIGGDRLVPSISAASILAKTFRDKLMVSLAEYYVGYDLERHKGYGTKAHYAKLAKLGPSVLHRRTFRGVVQNQE